MTSILKCKKMIIAEFLSRFEVHSRNWLLYMLDETTAFSKKLVSKFLHFLIYHTAYVVETEENPVHISTTINRLSEKAYT